MTQEEQPRLTQTEIEDRFETDRPFREEDPWQSWQRAEWYLARMKGEYVLFLHQRGHTLEEIGTLVRALSGPLNELVDMIKTGLEVDTSYNESEASLDALADEARAAHNYDEALRCLDLLTDSLDARFARLPHHPLTSVVNNVVEKIAYDTLPDPLEKAREVIEWVAEMPTLPDADTLFAAMDADDDEMSDLGMLSDDELISKLNAISAPISAQEI